jgi:hypothetical protein
MKLSSSYHVLAFILLPFSFFGGQVGVFAQSNKAGRNNGNGQGNGNADGNGNVSVSLAGTLKQG